MIYVSSSFFEFLAFINSLFVEMILAFIHASLIPIMYTLMAAPEGHLRLYSVCFWVLTCPWFLGDRRWIMFLCSHLLSDPKSLFSAVPKLKRNPCQMGTESFLTAPVVPKAWEVIVIPPFFWLYAPKIPSLWVFLLFNNCLSELLLSPGYGNAPQRSMCILLDLWLGLLGGGRNLARAYESLQVTEVMLLKGIVGSVSSTFFSLCPCEERSFAKIDASHGSQNSGVNDHRLKLQNHDQN